MVNCCNPAGLLTTCWVRNEYLQSICTIDLFETGEIRLMSNMCGQSFLSEQLHLELKQRISTTSGSTLLA